ncbi:chromosome partitioning protein [Intrasporangium chromatireducens Q5-1]|uniref:Chromosome partitioning protein n=1 Tax=Intrasporangium chromatireducens Q5-1 TaxID=584657 RepID=W9GNE9_9MICO|nr:AAA family ATPase [Intrasporangium chromatireducens]EWT07635.1 chromosome partitioning protein [Intrasporangium chromatireducens Q5-1]
MTILWDLDPTTTESYRFALGGSVEVLGHGHAVGRSIEEGGEHLVVIGPDVALAAACELAEQLRVSHPEVGVILLRHRLEVGVLAQALRSGIREVVQADDQAALADAVRRSEALTAQLGGTTMAAAATGKVVTVFSAKGGVGKTTLATNMSAYLSSTGARTLLVDLDLMFGDVAISLQLVPTGSVMDVVAMSGNIDLEGLKSVVTRHEPSGLDVLAAPSDPGDAERIGGDVITELLRVARNHYDYVVVDTPPSFTEHVLAAFDVSDLTVLVATLDIPALKNLRIALHTLDVLGAPKETRTVLLNRADLKVGLASSDVEAALKVPVVAEVPFSLSVPAAVNRGVPLVLEEPRSAVSLAMRHFVDHEVRQRFGETIQNGAKRSFTLLRSKR